MFLDGNLYDVSGSEFLILTVFIPIHVIYNYLCFSHYIVRDEMKILIGVNLIVPATFYILFALARGYHDLTFAQIYVVSVLLPAIYLVLNAFNSRRIQAAEVK